MTKILAWHGDQQLRDRIVARMHEHRAADNFIRGTFQRLDPGAALGYRGCAIGCLLDAQPAEVGDRAGSDVRGQFVMRPRRGWHDEVEMAFGIAWSIAVSIDGIFESIADREVASDFAVAAAEAIPMGADLAAVASWCYDESVGSPDEAEELLERLRSAPVLAGESRD